MSDETATIESTEFTNDTAAEGQGLGQAASNGAGAGSNGKAKKGKGKGKQGEDGTEKAEKAPIDTEALLSGVSELPKANRVPGQSGDDDEDRTTVTGPIVNAARAKLDADPSLAAVELSSAAMTQKPKYMAQNLRNYLKKRGILDLGISFINETVFIRRRSAEEIAAAEERAAKRAAEAGNEGAESDGETSED